MKLPTPPYRMVATVLGAGTMGAQIAAHFANAGIRTHLLDIVPRDTPATAPKAARNAIAAAAMKAMTKAKPAPYMSARAEGLISIGNFDDDLEAAVAASDLVVEAIVERLDIKQQIFARVGKAAKPTAILTSNTSGIPIGAIAQALDEGTRPRFAGMHWFNPPRYMHLLEVVPSEYTDPAVVTELANFSDRVLGKGVVLCRDTPNFIGNRVGIAEMLLTFSTTTKGYTVEEVDLLNGPLMGRPKTGSYRLGDMVGLDVVGHVVRNMQTALSGDKGAANYDELYELMVVPATMETMFERKLLGDKTGAGFYKKATDAAGGRSVLSLDLTTMEYRARIEPELPELAKITGLKPLAKRVHAALRAEGRAGEFLRDVYLRLFNYSANRAGEICDTPKQIDDAMCWGYGWQAGPFALWDMAGVAWGVEQLEKLGIEPAPAAVALLKAKGEGATWYSGDAARPKVFAPRFKDADVELERPAGVLVLDAVRAGDKALVHKTSSANLFDIGDGVALVEFTSKMNSIDAGVLELLMAAPQLAQDKGFVALVIGNEGSNFSVGANLLEMLMRAKQSDWAGIEQAVRGFQDTLMGLRHAPLPVVAAAHGMALGGGLEVCLHTDHVQANAESYMGLVEFGVGLVPAGGGLKEIVRRASEWAEQAPNTEPYEPLRRGFENVTTAKVATSALEAREFGFLRPSDGVTFHKARVIADAKTKALALAAGGYVPPDPNEPIRVIGRDRGASFMMGAQLFQWGGYASEHDALIARKVAHILTGGMGLGSSTVTAQHLLDLEREAFVSLVAMEKTQARMETMLMTGKPLRN